MSGGICESFGWEGGDLDLPPLVYASALLSCVVSNATELTHKYTDVQHAFTVDFFLARV